MTTTESQSIDINKAYAVLKNVVLKTPLQFHKKLSEKFGAEIYLKREDLQIVRSYKIRGAYNLIQSLSEEDRCVGWFAPVQATMLRVWHIHAKHWISRV